MNISFAITTHNEGDSIQKLLTRIKEFVLPDDEIIILDDHSDDDLTLQILENEDNVNKRKFDKDFADHKNTLNNLCSKEYIFQLDGDELPTQHLLKNIRSIIKANPDVELFALPRVNIVKGITKEHLKLYQWTQDKFKRINYPDYQGRIYVNKPHIKWKRSVHEVIAGYTKGKLIPTNTNLDIHHIKTIEKQEISNDFYYNTYTKDFKIK